MQFNKFKFMAFLPIIFLLGCGDSSFDVGKRVWVDLKSRSGSFLDDGYFEGTVSISGDDRISIEIEDKQNWKNHRWARKIDKGTISLLKTEVMTWEKGRSAWETKQQLADVIRPLLSSTSEKPDKRLGYFEAVADPSIVSLAEKTEIQDAIYFTRIIKDSMAFIRSAAENYERYKENFSGGVSFDSFIKSIGGDVSLESVVELIEANTRLLSEIPGVYESIRNQLEQAGKSNYAAVRSLVAKTSKNVLENVLEDKTNLVTVMAFIKETATNTGSLKGLANRAAIEVVEAADSVADSEINIVLASLLTLHEIKSAEAATLIDTLLATATNLKKATEAKIEFMSDDGKRPIGATPAKLFKKEKFDALDRVYAGIISTRIVSEFDARPFDTIADIDAASKEALEEAKSRASGLTNTARKSLFEELKKNFADKSRKVLATSVDDVETLTEASETYPKIGRLLEGIKRGSRGKDFKGFKARLIGKFPANLKRLIVREFADKPELDQVKEIHSVVRGIIASLRGTLSGKELKNIKDLSDTLFADHIRKQVLAYVDINPNDLKTVAEAELAFRTVRDMAQEYDKPLGITSFTKKDKERLFVGRVRGRERAARIKAAKAAANKNLLTSALSGTWEGYYVCNNNESRPITLNINGGRGGVYSGTLEVHPSSMNLDVERRKYRIQAALNPNNFTVQIRGTKWIKKPKRNYYDFAKLDGRLDKKMVRVTGRVKGYRCSTFEIKKQ